MIVLEALAARLAAANLGVIGETIFAGAMPLTVEQGLRLWPLPGTADELPGIRRSDIQIVARAATLPEAYELADGAYEAMSFDRIETAGIVLFSSRPWSQPFPFGREEGSLWHMAVNTTVIWRKD